MSKTDITLVSNSSNHPLLRLIYFVHVDKRLQKYTSINKMKKKIRKSIDIAKLEVLKKGLHFEIGVFYDTFCNHCSRAETFLSIQNVKENNSFLPWILSALQLLKKNSFCGNYSRKYGIHSIYIQYIYMYQHFRY